MIEKCRLCPLYKPGLDRIVPPEGPIDADLMFIGEAPGKEEDREGRPFVGKSGKEHDNYCRRVKIYRNRTRISNRLKCRPPDNADPTPEMLSACHDRLLEEIRETSPKIIGAIGRYAAQFFLGPVAMELVHGIPFEVSTIPTGEIIPRTIVIPMYHPSYGLHDTTQMTFISQDYEMVSYAYFNKIKPRTLGRYSTKERIYSQLTDRDSEALIRLLRGKTLISIDTESTDAGPWSLQISIEYGSAYLIRSDQAFLLSLIRDFVLRPEVITLLHNAPYDLPVLNAMRIDPLTFIDTMQISYILQDEPKGLKPLAFRILNMEMKSYTETVGEAQESKSLMYLLQASDLEWPDPEPFLERRPDGSLHEKHPQNIGKKIKRILGDYEKDPSLDLWTRWHRIKPNEGRKIVEDEIGPMPMANLSDIPFSKALNYACKDADATLGIFPYLMHKIKDRGLERALQIDMEMLPLVGDMRKNGMKINIPYMAELSEMFIERMDDIRISIEQHYYESTKKRIYINPNSTQQTAQILFDMGLLRSRKSSTDVKALDKIRKKHPIVPAITSYRECSKLKGTYSEALPQKVDEAWRLHPNISASTTTTGRLSESDPNLQNIPIRTELGRKIKEAFIPEEGCYLLSSDYGQIEMRMACHMSGDPIMRRLFLEGRDIHAETAAWIFKLPLDKVDPMKHRHPIKRTGFGILYAIGPSGLQDQLLSEGLEYSQGECEFFISSWFERYHYVKEYMSMVISEARRFGYVRDLVGRYRLIPEVSSALPYIQSAGERQAQNAPIQGGAQEVIKIAMANLRPIYKEFQSQGYICRPLNQVHDDLIDEVSEEIIEEFGAIKKAIMVSAIDLSIPITVDIKYGKSWAKMEKLQV